MLNWLHGSKKETKEETGVEGEKEGASGSGPSATSSTSSDDHYVSLDVTPEFPMVASGESKNIVMMASLRGPRYKPEARASIDLVLVVDRSGSMRGAKLDMVKRTLKLIIEEMAPEDRLGLVQYDTAVDVLLELTAMNTQGKDMAHRAVTRMEAGGCTDLCSGLLQGLSMMKERKTRNEVAGVLLFTDGLANSGITGASAIVQAMKNPTAASKGLFGRISDKLVSSLSSSGEELPCTVNTFGFGADHDAALLRAVAEAGGGMFYFIEEVDIIRQHFADCLGGLLSLVGQNVVLKVEALNDTKINRVITKYKTEEHTIEKVFYVTLGDIQSEEERDILVDVRLPSVASQDAAPVVRFTLEYFNVITNTPATHTADGIVARPENVPNDLKPHHEIDVNRNRNLAGEAMERAADIGKAAEDYERARKVLQDAADTIKASISSRDSYCKSLVTDLLRCKDSLVNRQEFHGHGYQEMHSNAMAHGYQRHTHGMWGGQERYQTNARQGMVAKFM